MSHHHLLYLPHQGVVVGTNTPPHEWSTHLSLVGPHTPLFLSWPAGTASASPYLWVRPVPPKMKPLLDFVWTTPLPRGLGKWGPWCRALWLGLLAAAPSLANPTAFLVASGLTQLRHLVATLPAPHLDPSQPGPQSFQFASRRHNIQVVAVPIVVRDAAPGAMATNAPWLLGLDLTTGTWFATTPTATCGQKNIFEPEGHHLYFVVGPRKPVSWTAVDPQTPCGPTPSDSSNSTSHSDEVAL